MPITRRGLVAATALSAAGLTGLAQAQGTPTLRIGVLNDQTGQFRDFGGIGSVGAVRQAVMDFAGHGRSVDVVMADHQNKPDVGAGIARQWLDNGGVDMIIDVPNSAVALAVNEVVRAKNKVMITSASATMDLTGPQCSPNTVQWTFDAYMLAKAQGIAMTRAGGTTWFLLYADFTYGQGIARDLTRFVAEAGGKMVGTAGYPVVGTTDFSSFLLQAQASGAKVLSFTSGGSDAVNIIKQAREFGIADKMQIAALLAYITDVHAIGLDQAQGILICSPFYWDLNERTRAFTQRYLQNQHPPFYPTMDQAGCYAGALHYLKAVAALGVEKAKADGAATVAQMKAMPTDDDAFGAGSIRADGRTITPAYLFRVKSPAESKRPWDYYELKQTLAGERDLAPARRGRLPAREGLIRPPPPPPACGVGATRSDLRAG